MSSKRYPTEEELKDVPEVNPAKMQLVGVGLRKDRKSSLRGLREGLGKTQVEVAHVADMNQSDISRLEQREDVRLSTLRRYVEALGGELEVRAVFRKSGHAIVIEI